MFDSYCLNNNGKRVYYVTQWDSDIELYSPKIFGYPDSTNVEIHIYNEKQENSFVLDSSFTNNSVKIVIPNILLTENCPIHIYIYLKSDTENKTIKEIKLPVRKKKRPDDYVYTQTDVKTWNDKLDKSGWNANKYLGTDNMGNVVEKDGSGGGEDCARKISANVKDYGAIGDGNNDDTQAFIEALENNRNVVVPDGNYKISNTLRIREGCRFEISNDTVLYFTQTNLPCISMGRFASLVGNHGNIFVPYDFNDNVIFCSTEFDGSIGANVPPWKKYDPVWKIGRFITDINISKPNAEGFTKTDDGVCNGTALFFFANGAVPITCIWGSTVTGLRIGGGFKYGVRAQNINAGWNHELRIEAVIEGPEIGVSLEKVNNAHIAVTVQPVLAINKARYCRWGIKLDSCNSIDLSQSAVWDWSLNSLWTGTSKTCEFQHIAMYGNCRGTRIYDFSMVNSDHFWQDIYCEKSLSMTTAIVAGAKGIIPPDPEYVFFKNFRKGGYDFNNDNITWRDPQNMVRWDIPVNILNPYVNNNILYEIGWFEFGPVENPVGEMTDILEEEVISIEENNGIGLIGWSNLKFTVENAEHYFAPITPIYENRVPIYFYSIDGKKRHIYRLINDFHDTQHVYNCHVSMFNMRRFHFNWSKIDKIQNLDKKVYKRLTPVYCPTMQESAKPKLEGQYGYAGNTPLICTKSAEFDENGQEHIQSFTEKIITDKNAEKVDLVVNKINMKTQQKIENPSKVAVFDNNGWVSYITMEELKTIILAGLSVKSPIIIPKGGEFWSTQQVEMKCYTPGADIYYTLDGSKPNELSNKYSTPFTISKTVTVKAIGVDPSGSYPDSGVTEAFFKSKMDYNLILVAESFSNSELYYGNGYANDRRVEWREGSWDSPRTGYVATGYIPCDIKNDIYYVKGVEWDISNNSSTVFTFTNKNSAVGSQIYGNIPDDKICKVETLGPKYYRFTPGRYWRNTEGIKWIRFSFKGIGENLIITKNIPIDN